MFVRFCCTLGVFIPCLASVLTVVRPYPTASSVAPTARSGPRRVLPTALSVALRCSCSGPCRVLLIPLRCQWPPLLCSGPCARPTGPQWPIGIGRLPLNEPSALCFDPTGPQWPLESGGSL